MAVGRITGPLLASNLLRDGIDLAVETKQLYLDVTTGNVGIQTATPRYNLDVNGTLRVTSTSTLGLITVSTITTTISRIQSTGTIVFDTPALSIGATTSQTVSINSTVTSDIIPGETNTYNIGSPSNMWANGYFDALIASKLTGLQGQDVNITPSMGNITNVNSNIRVWGDNPLGTAPVTTNILYVNMDGSDTNDGRAQDPSRACRTIAGALRSPFYKKGTSIKVAPGHYLENNPLVLLPYTSVIGSDLRTTVIEPINKTQDLFHLQSGCYLNYMQFLNGRSGLLPGPGYTPGTNRGAYATAFPPSYDGTFIDVYHSPYIQNCTNQSGPWLVDGTMFVPNQTVQVPEAVGTATWVANTTSLVVTVSEGTIQVGQSINAGPTHPDYFNARTLLLANKPFIQEQVIAYVDQNNSYYGYNQAKCERDTGLIVDSLVADLLFSGNGDTQSNFAGLQYWSQTGLTGAIPQELTTTTNAINYVKSIVEEIVVNTRVSGYQNTITQNRSLTPATSVEVTQVRDEFDIIVEILTPPNGLDGVTDLIVPNGISVVSTNKQNAVNIIQANKSYIQAEAIAYITANAPGFTYDQTKCSRDVSYMLDGICFDILYGGNRQAIQSGVYYYGFSSTVSAVAKEQPQTTAAYFRIKDIVSNIITNQAITPSNGNSATQDTSHTAATNAEASTLETLIDKITNIINTGPAAASTPSPISLTITTNTNQINAAESLVANRQFIINEVIAYVDDLYNNGFIYNEPKCYRDTGLIVDSLAFDLLYNGTSQSTFAGIQYWNQNGYTGQIGNEISTTTAAINYVSSLAQQVITNTTGTRYQSTVTQVTGAGATNIEQLEIVTEFNLIKNILTNGTNGVTDLIIPNGSATTATNTVNAYNLLQSNKAYIQAEVIAYITATKTPGFTYNATTCARDVGYMIDCVSFDLLHGGNRQAIQSGVYYYSFNASSTAVPNEQAQVVAAYEHIKNIAGRIIAGVSITPSAGNTATQITNLPVATGTELQTIYNNVDIITNIIANGPGVVTTKQPISLTASNTSTVVNAYNLLLANRAFIQAEVIAFINEFTTGFVYDRAKCYRDVGIIVENIAYDVAFGGNQKSIESGLAYWNGVTSVIPTEIPETASAINYINTLAQDIITNTPAPNLLGAEQTSPQVINTNLTNGATASNQVANALNIIANIVQNGPSVAPAMQVGAGPDWSAVCAEVLLQSNRSFIQNEVTDWIDQTYPNFEYREDLCYRDVGLIIDAITQDIILNGNAKTVEAAVTYWTGNTNIIANATFGQTDQTVETIAAINHARDVAVQVIANITATGTTQFTFNSTRCARDTGLIVDALAQDLLFNGTSQTTFAGIQYWNHGGLTGKVGSEVTTTTAAISYINTLAQAVVINNTSGTRYSTGTQVTNLPSATVAQANIIQSELNLIAGIILNGVSGITDQIQPNGLTPSLSADVNHAYALLQANKSYIQEEAIAYITATMTPGFTYDQATCIRDVGFIIDSVSFDLLYGGNRQAIQSGVYYWSYSSVSTALPKEIVASTQAYQYMSSIVQNIVTATPLTTKYSTATQITNMPAGTSVEVSKLQNLVTGITNIINQGPTVAPAKTPIGLVPSTNQFVVNAVNLLEANRSFIQAEVNAYVQATQVNNNQIILPFYDAGQHSTLAVQRNFGIITNIISNGPAVAPITTQGQGIFVTTGINASDVLNAPVVIGVSQLTTNTYLVQLSESTDGFGDNQQLYFGQTGVYPLLGADVPDRWAQRAIDPIGAMGGSLVDGSVVSSRSPITSFVYDAFTQVNQGGVGIHITNNGYAQLVSVFTIFCSNAVITENGGICSITNSNSNFGDICLLSKGYGKREFGGYVYNPPVAPYFPNGEYPKSGEVAVYIADPRLRPHIGLIMEVQPPTGYINNSGLPGFLTAAPNTGTITAGSITLNGIDTTGMVIGQNIYVIDQYGRKTDSNGHPYISSGTVISDINYQSVTLNYPFNAGGGDPNNSTYFTIYSCGNAYYTVLSSTVAADPVVPGTLLLPDNKETECVAGINYLSTLAQSIISNTPVTPLQTGTNQVFDPTLTNGSGAQTFVTSRLSTINSIITNGPSSAPTVTKTGTIPTGAGSAAALLEDNKEFLAAEVNAYMDANFTQFTYNTATCYRDTGLIVDAITQDMLFSTNSQSTFAGIQYWNQAGYVGAVGHELTTTTNAINYVSALAQEIVQNITTGTRYQSTVTQVTGIAGTIAEANTIATDFNVIVNILTTGTAGVTDQIIPNGIYPNTSVNVNNAYNLLQANKAYLEAEAIAYITATMTPGFTYDATTCARDVSYMVDSVSFDLLYGGNRQAIQSGTYYFGYSTTSTAIVNEIPQTVAAYNFIATLTQQILLGETITPYQTSVAQAIGLPTATASEVSTVDASINNITNIITNGPGVVVAKTPINLTRSTNNNVIDAAVLLNANRAFIQAEVIAYINEEFGHYNRATSTRDVGLLIDAVTYDLATGGNYNAVIAGQSYYATAGTHHVVTLEESVSDPTLFPNGAIINFYQRSYMSASGYLFEYVGAGANYGALPQVGVADPVQSKETVQLNNGKVFFTSTDQNGDFRIGTGLVISQATGVLSGRTFTKSLFANLTPFILAIEGS